MSKTDFPTTQAVRFLESRKIPFNPHLYPYEEHGGTTRAAECLHFSEHAVVKTLVMETDQRRPLLVLMHGDCEVSTKQLARILEVKRVTPCNMAAAEKHTGYQIGGISPFGIRVLLPVYVEKTVFELSRVYINGGKRGFLVEIDPQVLRTALDAIEVEVALR